MHRTSWAIASLLFGSAIMGCVQGQSPDDDLVDDEDLAEAESPLTTCVTIARGETGDIADTLLSGDYPGWATGAEPSLYTGLSGGGNINRSLLRADVSSIPAGALIQTATLSLSASWTAANNNVSVSPVLIPWSESTATAGNFDAVNGIGAAVTSFAAGNGGTKTVDITSLVSQWVSGTLANNGLALTETGTASHLFWSSETSLKPTLTVCYDPPPAGPFAWSHAVNLPALAADPTGNTIGAGTFSGTINLGSGPVTSTYTTGQFPTPTPDVFVVKYGPAGNTLWTKKFGDESIINPDNARDQYAEAVTTTSTGHIYVAGRFKGVMVNQGSPGFSPPYMFVLRLNPDGTAVGAQRHINAANFNLTSLGADSQGRALASGTCSLAVDGYCENGSFLIKDNADLSKAWQVNCRPGNNNYGGFTGAAIDGADNSIMGTVYSKSVHASVDCGLGPSPIVANSELILVKHDTNGGQVWLKQFPVVGGGLYKLAADSAGNIFLLMSVTGSLTLGATTLPPGFHLIKLDANASYLWHSDIGSVAPRGLTTAPNGDIFVSGHFTGSADFGFGPVASAGGSDTFLWRLTGAGAPVAAYTWGSTGNDIEPLVAVDGSGLAVFTGRLATGTSYDFGQGPLLTNYLVKLAP
ncbi:MAG: DNRLRE domain-containing protein [Polyangiaceae bacterium]